MSAAGITFAAAVALGLPLHEAEPPCLDGTPRIMLGLKLKTRLCSVEDIPGAYVEQAFIPPAPGDAPVRPVPVWAEVRVSDLSVGLPLYRALVERYGPGAGRTGAGTIHYALWRITQYTTLTWQTDGLGCSITVDMTAVLAEEQKA